MYVLQHAVMQHEVDGGDVSFSAHLLCSLFHTGSSPPGAKLETVEVPAQVPAASTFTPNRGDNKYIMPPSMTIVHALSVLRCTHTDANSMSMSTKCHFESIPNSNGMHSSTRILLLLLLL